MRLGIALALPILLAAPLLPAFGQEPTIEELNRMIEELDRAIEQTDELIGEHDAAIGAADEAIESIDRTLEQAAPYGAMAPIPLIGADGSTIDPQVGEDFEEAMWCLNGLDVFSQLVELDEDGATLINTGLDFFAGVAIEHADTLGLDHDSVISLLEEKRPDVVDTLETAMHPTQNMPMIDFCLEMTQLYSDMLAADGGQ